MRRTKRNKLYTLLPHFEPQGSMRAGAPRCGVERTPREACVPLHPRRSPDPRKQQPLASQDRR